MTQSNNARRLYALGFCVFTVPAIALLPKLGWLWASVSSIAAAGVLAIMIRLRRKIPLPLPAAAAKLAAGRLLLGAVVLWNLLQLGGISRLLCVSYPSAKQTPLLGLLTLLLAAYAAQKGTKVLLRAAAIVFFFLLGLYALLMGFSLPTIKLQWLAPQSTENWAYLTASLAPVSTLYLAGRERARAWRWLTGGAALAVLAALVCAGTLSPTVAASENFPFFTAAKSVSVLGAMERLEPLVSAAMTAGAFCLLGLLCCVNTTLTEQLLPNSEKLTALLNIVLGGSGFWLSQQLPNGWIGLGTGIFWGLLPLVLLLVVSKKKY